jgi:curli biogenesis system outer membrane secretion channel CsgG
LDVSRRRLVILTAVLLAAGGRAYAGGPQDVQAQPPPIGSKHSIAVSKIEATGGFAANEDWDAGSALSAMLTQALADSGRFVVVERDELSSLLNERELQANKLAGGDAGPKMVAAQYLVVGSVTDFGAPSKGGGLSIGGFGLGGGGSGGVALKRQSGKVRINLRLLDARTGEVLKAIAVTRSASRTGVGLTTSYKGLSSGANAFVRTPLGEASRLALTDAVGEIATALAGYPWQGRVVDWDQGSLVINAGSEAGLAPGEILHIERLERVLTDPATGRILSEKRSRLGDLVLESVEARIARGRFMPIDPQSLPARGDFVVAASGIR